MKYLKMSQILCRFQISHLLKHCCSSIEVKELGMRKNWTGVWGQFCFLFILRPEDLGRLLGRQPPTCLIDFDLWHIDQGTTMGSLPCRHGPVMSSQAPESTHD